MTSDIHDQVRELIVTGGVEDLSTERQTWLRAHLRECPACRDFEASFGQVTSALRAEPLTGDSSLVRATQARVHARAGELRQQRERNWIVFLSCLFVTISSAVTTPIGWQISEWIGAWAGLSRLASQAGFAFFWVAPVLAAGALLMACGSCWTSDDQEWQ